MPTWLVVVLAVLALPVLGTVVTLAYQKRETGQSEQKDLRRKGAEVVTPIQELISALPIPLAPDTFFMSSGFKREPSARDVDKRVTDWKEMWAERRQRLMVYAYAHPNEQVLDLCNQLVRAVNQLCDAFDSLAYKTRLEAHEVYDIAKARHNVAVAAAEALLSRIRGA
jgi:hypothetical protein